MLAKFFALRHRRILFAILALVGIALIAIPRLDFLWEGKEPEEEDQSEDVGEYFQYRFNQMKNASGIIPPGAQMNALAQRSAMLQKQSRAPLVAGISNLTWTAVGPGNIGGRIRAVLPISSTTVFIGGVAGGIWKTTNCCSTSTTWTPLNDFMANLAVSTLVVSPTNASIMYAGTGEGFYNADAVRGAGVFKSTDGGATWAQLSSTNNSNWYYVNRLAVSPNGATLLAATRTGIWRSTDGGTTWTQVNTDVYLKDVKFNPADSAKAVAGSGFLAAYYSTDGGATWNAAGGLPSGGTWLSRIEVAYAPSDPTIVYAGLNRNSGELWKSTDGGQNYALANTGTSYMSGQGWYDNALWVNPTDPTNVVVAGLDIYKSTNSGTTLTKISRWQSSWGYVSPPSPHADHHALVSIPGSSAALLDGNDGGLYYTSDIATAGNNPSLYNNGWVYLNNTLGITQFYGVAGNASGTVYGGSQDNGTSTYTTGGGANGWTFAFGGDGGESAIDPTDANYMYGEYVYAEIHRSSNGGTSASYIYSTGGCNITDAGSGSTAMFIAPFILDPNSASTLYVGAANLWKSVNVKAGSPCWASVKSPVSGTPLISAIAVAPTISNTIWVGYTNGRIEMTTDGGATWTRVDTNIGVDNPGTQIGSIAIDRNTSGIVYVGFTGYGANRLWRTANGGATWTNITSNLPQAPIYAVAINPARSDFLYVGTEIGIFASADTGTSWNVPGGSINGDGPANVATFDLQWKGGGNSTGTTTLIAGTHGRGAFTADTSGATALTVESIAVKNDNGWIAPVVLALAAGVGLAALAFRKKLGSHK